jgi:protein-S-isoprenylcysteine O-methyltransferase Ste14
MGLQLPLWPTAFVIPLGLCFYYFLLAGSRTFVVEPEDDLSSGIAQFSFFGTGMLATILLGYRAEVSLWNAIGGAALMACSLLLYEWARRTIFDRRFHIGWSGEVPDAVCEDGPYACVRHPIYASYMLAFAAQLAALPSPWTLLIFVLNLALFAHAARDDERSLAASDLAAEYSRYKRRTGMFLPRLGGAAANRARPRDGE